MDKKLTLTTCDKVKDKADINENALQLIDERILKILLKDRTTNKNIVWATYDYQHLGKNYKYDSQITIASITGENSYIIKPRNDKKASTKQDRIKKKAEVFTPAWVCNAQNNLVDNNWFERENVFNTELAKTWITNDEKVAFPSNKTWKQYVTVNILEITCGEAPYITSRYDAVTGKYIEVKDRIGCLDRKLRIVSENTTNKKEWLKWAEKALKSVYGYDWQGDNVLLSRENLLFCIAEYYEYNFNEPFPTDLLINFAKIISWNVWQMDGLKCVIPDSCKSQPAQFSMFETEDDECPGCRFNDIRNHTGIYCKIMDWELDKPIPFVSLLKN